MNIIILLMMCGSVDTVIIKEPSQRPVYTHTINQDMMKKIMSLKEPIVIQYSDDRGTCA